jgi:hypothetical protein
MHSSSLELSYGFSLTKKRYECADSGSSHGQGKEGNPGGTRERSAQMTAKAGVTGPFELCCYLVLIFAWRTGNTEDAVFSTERPMTYPPTPSFSSSHISGASTTGFSENNGTST